MKNRVILGIVAMLPLSACLGLGGQKPPPTLFTLATPSPAELPSRSAKPGAAVTVVVPTVPAALQTLRIPVRINATEYAYVKHAQWVEAPNSLFQRLVADTITARTQLVVLDPRQTTHDPGHRLTGQLVDFGVDTAGATSPVAKVRYDATMTLADGSGIATRRFEATRPTDSHNPRSITHALNDAAAEVAEQVADWLAAMSH